MATIALYNTWASQMPMRLQETKHAVMNYQNELFSLKSQVLTIDSRICNMDDVISFTQKSAQEQEEKISSLDVLDKNNEEFILNVVEIDEEVRDLITQGKEEFYALYSYLKPECEKSWAEKARDWLVSANVWCREHWKAVVVITLAVVAVTLLIVSAIFTLPAFLVTLSVSVLLGTVIGGISGGGLSALKGGSFWEGAEDGAFAGAIGGLVFSSMSFAFVGLEAAGAELTLSQSLLASGVAGALTAEFSDIGDIIFKGADISIEQIWKDMAVTGAIYMAFTGIMYGARALVRGIVNSVRGGAGAVEGGSGTKGYSVDPTMFADDEAAGVLRNGEYITNPTARNINDYIHEGSNYLGSKNMNGQYMYVIDMDGNIIIGTRTGQRMPHPTLVGGNNPQVQAAGILEIRGGKIFSINNSSGHFKPGNKCLSVVEELFSKLPQNIFSKDFLGYLSFGE